MQKGDLLVVKAGESIPVDGVLVEGSASVDESAITGESIPVDKQPGDRLIRRDGRRSGYCKMRAEKVGDETALSQIIRLVDEATSSKAPIAKLADKVAGVFVPVVIAIAVVAAVVWLLCGATFEFALTIAVSVLVVSCPCALGLATPHGDHGRDRPRREQRHPDQVRRGPGDGARRAGRRAGQDRHHHPGPAGGDGPRPQAQVSEETLLTAAASLEALSEHPLARAIVEEARRRGVPFLPVTEFSQIPGQGIQGKVEGKVCLAGNRRMMDAFGVRGATLDAIQDRMADEGKTPLFFAADGELLGVIAVADVVKPTSRQAVADLQAMGIEVVMLTGDNRRTAEAIRRQVSVDRVVAEVLPEDKEREIRALQESGRKVAMVGDGINDAPAHGPRGRGHRHRRGHGRGHGERRHRPDEERPAGRGRRGGAEPRPRSATSRKPVLGLLLQRDLHPDRRGLLLRGL